MTRIQKIKHIAISILMLLGSFLSFTDPDEGYMMIVTILGCALLAYGLSSLWYFFTMARYMVGGKYILYKGVIITDFGFLSFSLNDIPRFYVLIYLIAIHIFSGLVEILRALENKNIGASWKLKFYQGISDIALAVACIIFINFDDTPVYIYAIGLLSSAVIRLVQVFRRHPASFMSST